MAGYGTRTKELGIYKPSIKIGDKTIFEIFFNSIRHLINPLTDEIYIGITRAYWFHGFKDLIKIIDNVKVKYYLFDETPPGQAYTINGIVNYKIFNNNKCIVINADQEIDFQYNRQQLTSTDAIMPLYVNTNGKSSYVSISDEGYITRIVEKEPISFYASAGVYVFGSTDLLRDSIAWGIKNKMEAKDGELYLAPCMNYIIEIGGKIFPAITYKKYDLGNVSNINMYKDIV